MGGAFFGGSDTAERTKTNNCDVQDPNSLRFCHVVPPFRTMFKPMGMYPFPAGINVTAFLRGYPGWEFGAAYRVNTPIEAGPLTNTSIPTQLAEPQTMFRP